MLNALKKMQIHLNQISQRMNCNKCHCNNVHNKCDQLKQWILSLFGEKIGKEYVKIIIHDEGFDDIDVFCDLSDNDLKEIGINKKGHRMKFVKEIREYRDKKIQSLMINQNRNVKVSSGAALDAQDTEGKE